MNCYALHWTEYFKAIGPTLIGVYVAYVAYQQWQVNRANLREKLFDRRFDVFKKTQTFLSVILRDAKFEDEDLAEFTPAVQYSTFKFDGEIAKYLKEIRDRAIEMRHYQRKLEGVPVGQKRNELVDMEDNELKWLSDQISHIFKKFEPYLGFNQHE